MPLEKDASIYIVKLRDICGVLPYGSQSTQGSHSTISSEVRHRGVGVNSGRKLGVDTQTIPEANRRTRSFPG